MEQESTQEGATAEQPKEEISKETPKEALPEKKETSEKVERVYSAKEFSKIQSMKDKAEATLKSVQGELQKLHDFNERQRLEVRQKELEALADDPDGLAKVRHKHQLEDEINKLEQKRLDEEGAVARKYDQAASLAKEHKLSLDEARELLDATSPKEMELMAKLMAVEHEKVSSTEEKFIPDSGKSDTGGESDETFMKRYSEGKSNDHKRAQKILQKMK